MSILASLVKNCDGTQRQRLLNKFVENDHEKVDRLMELHFKYLEKVHGTDERIEKQKRVIYESFLYLEYLLDGAAFYAFWPFAAKFIY